MGRSNDESGGSVTVSMEITGEYEEVMRRLGEGSAVSEDLAVVMEDLATIVEIVEDIDGGTRSKIADQLAGTTAIEYGPEDVVAALQVLERYGAVTLEGNTWKPSGQRRAEGSST